MTRRIFISAASIVAIMACFAFAGDSDSLFKLDGGPPYNTNAPSEKTCSGGEGTNSCHGGGIPDNSGPGTPSITFSGGNVYVPGQTYTVTVNISHPASNKFGFQIVSLADNNNLFAGTIQLLDTARTRSQQPTWGVGQDRVFVMHRIAGTIAQIPNLGQWSYQWTAPSVNTGNISFYVCCLAANDNGLNDGGDETYWTKITINPSAVAIVGASTTDFEMSVYPNPATDFLKLNYIVPSNSSLRADLVDMKGSVTQELVSETECSGTFSVTRQLGPGLASGSYFVRTCINGKEYLKKLQIR